MGQVLSASFLNGGKKDVYLFTSSLHGGKKDLCPPFCGTANKHCLILWSVRSLYHAGLLQDFLYPQCRNRNKCCHGNTSCLILLKNSPPPIHAEVWNAKNPQKYISQRNIKKVLPWFCVAEKLKSVQGFGMQRYPTKCLSQRNIKKCCQVLPKN